MVACVIAVRQVGAKDRAAWMALWSEWQEHMHGAVPEHISEKSFDLMVTEGSAIKGFLAVNPQGTAVGFANVSATPFAWTGGPILFLQDLFVSKSHRGRGVGKALIAAIYAEADALGAEQVFWFVDEADAELQAFYEACGTRTPYLRFMRRPWPW